MKYLTFKNYLRFHHPLNHKFNKVLLNGFKYGIFGDEKIAGDAMKLISNNYEETYSLYFDLLTFHNCIKLEDKRLLYEEMANGTIADTEGNCIKMQLNGYYISIIYYKKNNDTCYPLLMLKVNKKVPVFRAAYTKDINSILRSLLKVADDAGDIIAFKNFTEEDYIKNGIKNKNALTYSLYWYFSHISLNIKDYDHDIYIIDIIKFSGFQFIIAYIDLKDDDYEEVILLFKCEDNNLHFICELIHEYKDITNAANHNLKILIAMAAVIRFARIRYVEFTTKLAYDEMFNIRRIMDEVNK